MAASSGNGGAAAAARQLRVLLPSSRDILRIPDELAEEIGGGEALIVSPGGGKGRAVWRVELRRGGGGGGAFLGRGWPEFAAAHGVAAAGWHLVLRHRGRGLLTVKAFDPSCCIRDLGAQQPAGAVQASMRSKENDCKPQFICMLSPASMEKMLIPAKFVQHFIAKGELNSHMAVVFGPLGKVNSIKLEMDQSDVFFAGGWPHFLAFHDITESNALLLRYEGNMVFTVKVFEPDGCQRKPKHKDNIMQQSEKEIISKSPYPEKQQEALSVPISKRNSQINLACSDVHKPKDSMPSLNEASLQRNSFYEIGQPSWIKKQINTDTLENHLALPIAFSDAIGLRKPSMITFKTTMTGSWQVRGLPCDNHSYILVHGWRRFCEDNNVKEGDICTFNVIKTTMWHVVITRYMPKLPGTAFASSAKCNSSDDRSSSEGQEMSKGSITSSNKASSQKKPVYEIGPPAWIKKKILNTNNRYFTLSVAFCSAIGLREACTITLKTSLSRRSWQVHVHPYKTACFFRSGWDRFCRDNKIKEGDICTFNVVETTLWHVVVVHR
ncbi:unnamed protein product [Urochloa humidicola]